MTAILLLAKGELRSRLAGWLALVLVAGIGAGAVMTAAAGARRTDSAYRRFERAQLGADVVVYPSFGSDFAAPPFEQVARQPQVLVAGRVFIYFAFEQVSVVSEEAPVGTGVDRPKLLHGRLPRAANEANASFDYARRARLHVGSTVPVHLVSGSDPSSPIVPVTLRVVGIEALPGEFPPQPDAFGGTNVLHVSPATFAALRANNLQPLHETVVRLRRGAADIPAFVNALHDLVGGRVQLNGIRSQQAADVQTSIHLQAVALWLVAGLLGVVTLAVLSQLLARQAMLDAVDHPTVGALGMTRAQVWTSGMIRAGALGVLAAVLGAGLAVALSPLTPIGVARVAEPHPGVMVDPLVLALGAASALVLILVAAAWPLWRAAALHMRAAGIGRGDRPSRLARAAAGPALPPTLGAGLRMALVTGSDRRAIPVRSSLLAVATAVTAVVAAVTFAGSLDHLLATPRLYGWNWEAHATTNGATGDADAMARSIAGDANVVAFAAEDTPPMAIGSTEFDAIALRQMKGLIEPVVLEGRSPKGPDEVALGTATMRKVHAHVGSTVTMRITAIAPQPAAFRVVGRVVLPPHGGTTRLGAGALFDISAEARMIPAGVQPPALTEVAIRFAPGVDPARGIAALERELGNDYAVNAPIRPVDLVNFGRVQNLPLVLAGLLGLLGAATMAHTLMTSIRRRRRELSILKTLGFTPSQVRWAVAWQATAFVVAAIAIGLPLGAAVGRLVWSVFAHHLGAVSEPVTPILAIVISIVTAVVVANLVAAVPAAVAGRMRPASALRTE
jgi:hypothetical protein